MKYNGFHLAKTKLEISFDAKKFPIATTTYSNALAEKWNHAMAWFLNLPAGRRSRGNAGGHPPSAGAREQ
jgi:hypothetical protein